MATRNLENIEGDVGKESFLRENDNLLERIQASRSLLEALNPNQERNLPEMVISLLSAPHDLRESRSHSEELAALNNLINATFEAVKTDVLSEREAEALLRVAIANFIEKQLDQTIHRLFSPPKTGWFLATRKSYEREE